MSRFRHWLRRRGWRARAGSETRLQQCRECGEDFVHPVTWTESGPEHWWLLLRCGGCGEWRDVITTNEAVAAFDRILDEAIEVIRRAADRLEREWLMAQADTFGAALRLDLLTAEDFR